jgi:lipopolysaccharide heptosyltransferase II
LVSPRDDLTRSPGRTRILIVLLGAIGDVMRAMPLAMRMRRGLPEAHLAWAVEPTAAPLLERHPAIDERLIFRRDRGALAFLRFLNEVRRGRFDLVLDLQRHLKSGVVSSASRARKRIGFHRSNTKEGNWLFNTESIPPQRHWSSKLGQYLAFADRLGLPASPIEFGLGLTPEEEARVEGLLAPVRGPFVAAFVGSSWPSRWWFVDRTVAVLNSLAARSGLGAVLLGAAGDEAAFTAEVAAAVPGAINLAGRTTLRDLVGILGRARVAFGPDCGPMHVAAAVGTPVVSLWGATSPVRSAPYGAEDLALVGHVACQPCYLRRCPVGRVCMQQIDVETVIAAIDAGLRRHAA